MGKCTARVWMAVAHSMLLLEVCRGAIVKVLGPCDAVQVMALLRAALDVAPEDDCVQQIVWAA